MGNINDTSFRKTLAERFLDCDTSVEEERELARFYQECMDNGCIPEGEEDICRLITGTVECHAGEATPVATCTSRPRRKPWQWLAAACAVGIVVAGVTFALATRQGDSPTLADADTSAVRPICNVGHEGSESTCVPTMASTPTKADAPEPPHNEGTSMPTRATREVLTATTTKKKPKQPATSPTADISNICHASMDAFHDATDISIERKGNALLLSTATDDGTCRRYVVNENGKGQVTLIEI